MAFLEDGRAEAAQPPPRVFVRGQQVYAANWRLARWPPDLGLLYYLDSFVPPERRLPRGPPLGEESRGWMDVGMGRMMGGTMGRGMMHPVPGRP